MSAAANWPELVRHPDSSDHVVHVYQDPALLADATAEFVAAGLSLGEGALVIARRERHEAILAALGAKGQHARSALSCGCNTPVCGHTARWSTSCGRRAAAAPRCSSVLREARASLA